MSAQKKTIYILFTVRNDDIKRMLNDDNDNCKM